jgi:hypothetical protein
MWQGMRCFLFVFWLHFASRPDDCEWIRVTVNGHPRSGRCKRKKKKKKKKKRESEIEGWMHISVTGWADVRGCMWVRRSGRR